MKIKLSLLILTVAAFLFTACDEQIMDWHKDPSHDEVSAAELPLQLAEKITRYDALKTYSTNYILGIGMGLDEYLSNPSYRNIVNENFHQITVGYAMKHGPMVNSNGSLNYLMVDSLLRVLDRNGLEVFGHTLIWHANQNATYLNSIIAPKESITNLINNGTFESGLTGWSKWNGSTDALSLTTTAYQGSGAMKVINAENNATGQWKTQINTGFNATLVSGTSYTLTYYIKSDAAGSVRCSTTGSAKYQADQTTGPTWSKITWTFTADGGETGFNFDLGKVAGTYYIDNIVIGLTNSPKVELADTTKTRIIGDAMKYWISNMVGHYKNKVHAWDVVNEPMSDSSPANLKTGVGATLSSDNFYWQDYLGKDYAVTAFKLARLYGNANDKLFINDYNLEYSIAKCQGLINYVNYIESKGAKVDGIGTQMHIKIDTDTAKIKQMFQLLAATGKLIRISELDIQVNTANPTTEILATQAAMYQFVINAFNTIIPKTQQYDVTIWGVSDNAKEHVNWIPNDAPNLWDAKYARKHAYKGVADGLAGEDVSKHFTGELQY
ncbi:MAG: endo-1,4-beta-xylanase [Paludibacter sp.]